jgi:hypothetical protein
MTRVFWSLVLGASSLVLVPAAPAAAQAPGTGAGAGRAERPLADRQLERLVERQNLLRQSPNRAVTDSNAHETRQQLQEMLQHYPPTLGTVLAVDPTLLDNEAYLQPYPQLLTFLAQHPDVAHNPGFYFESQLQQFNRRNDGWNDPKIRAIQAIDQALGGLAAMVVGLTIIGTIAWVIRSVIEHRKWLRVSKTHVDTHAKLMDRLTSNEDLITYMQSPAGRRFLDAAPIPLDGGPKMLNAPFGRILWSVQAGVVVGALGAGLIYASMRLAASPTYADGETPLLVVGIAALAIGCGFFVSAIAAYGLSSRLGLFAAGGGPASGSSSDQTS